MPKVKFDREEIINTTFELLKNDGIRGISARNIAKKIETQVQKLKAERNVRNSRKQLKIGG